MGIILTFFSEIKAVLMKFVGVANEEVMDLYYQVHPVYLLFDFSLYKQNAIDQHYKVNKCYAIVCQMFSFAL